MAKLIKILNRLLHETELCLRIDIKETLISEGLRYHVDNNIPLHESIYRPYSEKFYELIVEARRLRDQGKYLFSDDPWLAEENVGQFIDYRGRSVPLDLPISQEWFVALYEEETDKSSKELNKPTTNAGKGKKYVVFVKDPSTGRVKKVTFGDKKGGLRGNWNDPKARANFASRHNCASKTDKLTAGYWACRAHKYFGKNVPGKFW